MSVTVKQTNEEYIQSLKDRGLKTTRTGAKEADFVDYGNALGANVQKTVMDSFDKEQDYALQAKIAAGWKNSNVKSAADVQAFCKANGIEVKINYEKTQYIVDNKKGGKYANNTKNATNGSIAIYTFSDGKGGEIKIADANGNGALETEELFMNEILSGVTSDLKVGEANQTALTGESVVKSASNDFLTTLDTILEQNKAKQEDEKAKEENKQIKKFYEKVSDIMKEKDCSEQDAIKEVMINYPSLMKYAPEALLQKSAA